MNDRSTSATVASVERAADVLIYFVDRRAKSLGVSEIARGLDLPKAAVYRMLASLRSRGLVSYNDEDRRYGLGPMALAIGLQCLDQLDVRRIALPYLSSLSREFNETATLSIRSGSSRIYVDQVTPPREVIVSISVGVAYPLHSGASSKTFLAFMSEDEVAEYFTHGLDAITPNTVTDRKALHRELTEIQANGWSHSQEERQSGASSIAAPIMDHERRPVAVMSICGPAVRFPSDLELSVKALLAMTTEISHQMGYIPT